MAAEILEHIPADVQAIDELARVLRPGGTVAVTVPRWLPEVICWRLSDDYHDPGGPHRIYTDKELVEKLANAGLEYLGLGDAHGLHSPLLVDQVRVGVTNDTIRLSARTTGCWCGTSQTATEHAVRRGRAQPADRQEPGGLPQEAGCDLTPMRRRRPERRRRGPDGGVDRRVQEPDGAIPWTTGQRLDVWKHVESALDSARGEAGCCRAELRGAVRTQRPDGS